MTLFERNRAGRALPRAAAAEWRGEAFAGSTSPASLAALASPAAAGKVGDWFLSRPPLAGSASAWRAPPSPAAAPREVAPPALDTTAAKETAPVELILSNLSAREVADLREENILLNEEQTWRLAEARKLREEADALRHDGAALLDENARLRANYTQLWLAHEEEVLHGSAGKTNARRGGYTYEVHLHNDDVESKNKVVLALIEAVGLGIFGVDRCYMGQRTAGIVKGLTFGGFMGWAVLDYMIVLVNSLEKAPAIDCLYFNATFTDEILQAGAYQKAQQTTTDVDAAYYIMIIAYVLLFLGEVFSWVHFKLSHKLNWEQQAHGGVSQYLPMHGG